MDKLKITDWYALDLGDMFGIPMQRREIISKELDLMMVEASTGPRRYAYASQIYKQIESFCDSDEEFAWALSNHIQWLAWQKRLRHPKDNT